MTLFRDMMANLQGENPTPPKKRSRRVLVVAAETAVRDMARRTLEGAGFAVATADNAAAALTLATEPAAPIDLLLTTVAMPGLSGPSLAAELADRLPDLRVVYLSGLVDAAGTPRDSLFALTPAGLLRRVRSAING